MNIPLENVTEKKMEEELNKPSNITLELFLNTFFDSLKSRKIQFCVIGNYSDLPHSTENDVDIWVNDHKLARSLLKATCKDIGLSIFLENNTCNGSNIFMASESGETLHIDLMTDTSWRSLITILSPDFIQKNMKSFKTFQIMSEDAEGLAHLLYPLVTLGRVKKKYRNKLTNLSSSSQNFRQALCSILGESEAKNILSLIESGEWSGIEDRKSKIRLILTCRWIKSMNSRELKKLFRFGTGIVYRYVKPTGLTIAFIGNDGCGKSTIVENLGKLIPRISISENYRSLYWRPYLLPELKALFSPFRGSRVSTPEHQPTGLTNPDRKYNKIISIFKLIYYTADYVTGSIVLRFQKSRGGLIVFDRHYDDLLVFPERFGMTIPKSLTKLLRVIVPKPDITIFLSLSPREANRRKSELPIIELTRQINEYNALADEHKSILSLDANQSIEHIVDDVKLIAINNLRKKLSGEFSR